MLGSATLAVALCPPVLAGPLHPCGSHFSPLWAAPEQARPAAAVGLEGLKGLLFSCAAYLEQLCVLTEERLVAVAVTFLAKTLFTDKADQTWVCVGSPYLSALYPGPAPGCGDAACAVQVRASCVLPHELSAPWGLGCRGGRQWSAWGCQFLSWHLSLSLLFTQGLVHFAARFTSSLVLRALQASAQLISKGLLRHSPPYGLYCGHFYTS